MTSGFLNYLHERCEVCGIVTLQLVDEEAELKRCSGCDSDINAKYE